MRPLAMLTIALVCTGCRNKERDSATPATTTTPPQTSTTRSTAIDPVTTETSTTGSASTPTTTTGTRTTGTRTTGTQITSTQTTTATTTGPIGEDPSACALSWAMGTGTGIGFPTPTDRLASVGTVRAKVLFVDFQDVTTSYTAQAVFDMLSPGASEFFEAVSYGRLQLVLDPHLQWLRLSHDASHYASSLTSFTGHRDFISEAVALADPAVDFSTTDLVVVMSAPNATSIPYGPTWMGVTGWEITADGNPMTNGITSGTDILYWGSTWLNHEMGHSMGLPDLYDFSSSGGFTRPFSLMDLIDSDANEPLAWERWQLGWLLDEQIVCNPAIGSDVTISPIETSGGHKAVIVRTSSTRVVVIESRRALGYDAGLRVTGAVVSTVDATISTGNGPIRVHNGQQALLPGESVQVDGVTVQVVAADDRGDTIRITVP